MQRNPFASSTSKSGQGTITLSRLLTGTPVLETVSYQYPLKLIAPSPVVLPLKRDKYQKDVQNQKIHHEAHPLVHTVFLLTYGGGLVSGDKITLNITVAPKTRLLLLTQGSTKIFKAIPKSATDKTFPISSQYLSVSIGSGAAVCYLPDPTQPFADSAFVQSQIYELQNGGQGSLCACDWVSEGRSARGEAWSFHNYVSQTELWHIPYGNTIDRASQSTTKKLVLRDNIALENSYDDPNIVRTSMNGLGVFGTLVLYGDFFKELGSYFLTEFKLLPRIGGRVWEDDESSELTADVQWRSLRVKQEVADRVLWTAASTRGCTVVKFGAREVEGARRWLKHMLTREGTVEREFGERALLCLR